LDIVKINSELVKNATDLGIIENFINQNLKFLLDGILNFSTFDVNLSFYLKKLKN